MASGTSSGTFEKTSFDWWIQQQQQRSGEWFESLFSGIRIGNLGGEDWALPDWFLQGFFWTVIIAIAGGILWQLYQILQPYLDRYLKREKPSPQPASPKLTAPEWLERSRQAQQQGNYREACRGLYMAALQQLNDRNLIRQEPSRTDGEYLSLTTMLDPYQPYQTLIRTHERLCFSDAAVTAETYDRCWQAYQEIQTP